MKPVLECKDNIAFMRELPDESFKLIVTSPPYNLGKEYEGKEPLDTYLALQERVIKECVRLLDQKGSICWQVGNYVENGEIVPLDTLLYPIFRGNSLKLRNRIVWHFGHGLHCNRRLSGRYETINWWTKGDDYTWHLEISESPQNTRTKGISRGQKRGSCHATQKAKTPVMFGFSQMSKATIPKRPFTLASFLLS